MFPTFPAPTGQASPTAAQGRRRSGPTCGPPWPASATAPTRSVRCCASSPPRATSRTCCERPSGCWPPPGEPATTAVRNELLQPAEAPEEQAVEGSLRPRRLDEFVGQVRLREHLEILLEAA